MERKTCHYSQISRQKMTHTVCDIWNYLWSLTRQKHHLQNKLKTKYNDPEVYAYFE